jgi:hypothetical protein
MKMKKKFLLVKRLKKYSKSSLEEKKPLLTNKEI